MLNLCNNMDAFALKYIMKVYVKRWVTQVSAPTDVVWTFFSNPANLQKITPEDMNFDMLTDLSNIKMYTGQLISYKVAPLAGIPLQWVTKIIAVEEQKYFIDEQLSGPFALWHHEHRFEPEEKGVKMIDTLHYALPLGIIGRLAHKIAVAKRIDHIFDFRQKMIDLHFAPENQGAQIR